MFRFLGLVKSTGPAIDPAFERLASKIYQCFPSWSVVVDERSLKVISFGSRPSITAHHLDGFPGVVLGTLFRRSRDGEVSSRCPKTLDDTESAKIVASRGRHLIDNYWGRYVAALVDRPSGHSWLIRDPTGGLPCLILRLDKVTLFAASIEDIAALNFVDLTVNWDFIRTQLVAWLVESRQTGLNEIENLLAGECMEFASSRASRSFYWSPLTASEFQPFDSVSEATRALRTITRSCIHAWASCHPGILHRLSGGLDSSIVLGCLRDAPSRPRITCLTYYTENSGADERHYARLAANHAGKPLLEWRRNPRVKLDRIVHIALSPKPGLYCGIHETSEQEAQLARAEGLTAFFTGGGGDQLFYQRAGTLALVDYFLRRGVNPRLLGCAIDAAYLEKISVGSVLRSALTLYRNRKKFDPLAEFYQYRQIVHPDVVEWVRRGNRFLHSWFTLCDSVPPGKLWHAYWLSFPMWYYDPLGADDNAEKVDPLISQPIVECCLRIPTYLLIHRGIDRAIARSAFEPDVPMEILRRRSKGIMEDHAKDTLLENLRFCRDLLLDGVLAGHGLLDRRRLDESLSGEPSTAKAYMAEVFVCLSAEAWLRRWMDQPKRKASAQESDFALT